MHLFIYIIMSISGIILMSIFISLILTSPILNNIHKIYKKILKRLDKHFLIS